MPVASTDASFGIGCVRTRCGRKSGGVFEMPELARRDNRRGAEDVAGEPLRDELTVVVRIRYAYLDRRVNCRECHCAHAATW